MSQRFHHTGFVVEDRDRAVVFYRDVLGLNVVTQYERIGEAIDQVIGYEGAHLKSALLDLGGGHMLELIQYLNPPAEHRPGDERNVVGATHLALLVDDIHATFDRLSSEGARMMNAPAELAPGRIACYFQDPDGNWLELVEVRD